MRIRPLHSNVLIRQRTPAEMSRGGIVIPDTAKKDTNEGEVLAVGPGQYTSMGFLVPNECKVGETVYWSKYQGTEFTDDDTGEKLWLVREDNIVGHGSPAEAL